MFVLPGILLLLIFIYARPQEYFLQLQSVPLLYLFLALAIFGWVIDLKQRLTRPSSTPQLIWVILFTLWCLISVVIRDPSALTVQLIRIVVPVALYLLIAHGLQTFRTIQIVLATMLGMVMFLSIVGVHQGSQEFTCHVIDYEQGDDYGINDGRPCENRRTCEDENAQQGADYMCEKPGLFGTHSIAGGRVRYRGVLQDPNELSLAIGITLPFAFAFFERRRSTRRLALLIVSLILISTCTVYTQSRGGQLVFLAVTGAYFARRYGARGLLVGGVLGAPMLLLGGRSGEAADASSMQRIEALYEGMTMVKRFPFLGVGSGQFTQHHAETAHNSYVLAPAELGIPGMIIWTTLMFLSAKIPIQALRRATNPAPDELPFPPVVKSWAMALVAALVGLLIGIFFLSFCYHPVLWIYVGLTGAFYAAVRTHAPDFRVTLTGRDFGAIIAFDILVLIVLFGYTRLKMGMGA